MELLTSTGEFAVSAGYPAEADALRAVTLARFPLDQVLAEGKARDGRSTSPTRVTCGSFVMDTSDDIRSFEGSWPAMPQLDARKDIKAYAFQCCDHLSVWMETIGAMRRVRPFFVSIRNERGDPVMMIPLGVEIHRGIRVLGFLDGGIADYNAPVIYDAARRLSRSDVLALWGAICRAAPAFDVALLQKIPRFVQDQPNPLCELAPERWPASGYYLSLPPGEGDRVLERSSYCADNRRQRKRISEIGFLKFGIARSDGEIARVFEAFVRQKSRKYREMGSPNGLEVPAIRSYYMTLARKLGDGVQLSYMSVNDEIVSTHWGLIAGRRFYYLMPAYEGGDWRRFSPGRLLMEELVAWSCRNGIETFDLGIGDEPYKLHWRAESSELGGGMHPRTVVGRIYCASVRFRRALKQRLPRKMIASVRALQKSFLA
jgi:CelD/BcsL family acetyltransferase involved in cellulose biosynthesis